MSLPFEQDFTKDCIHALVPKNFFKVLLEKAKKTGLSPEDLAGKYLLAGIESERLGKQKVI